MLGPLEVCDDGRTTAIGTPRTRAVLAILLSPPNRLVSVDRLTDELWPDHPPLDARALVRGYVSRLRRALRNWPSGGSANGRLVTRKPGYLLLVGDQELDLHRFERLLADARAAGRAGQLHHSLALYRSAERQRRGARRYSPR